MENDTIKEICDDQQISSGLNKKLCEQRKNGRNCDYALKTGNGQSFKVHRCVLESVSPFFETMFNSEFNDKKKDSFIVKHCSSVVLEKIIEFMYTGKIEITSDIAKSTLDTALFLGLNSLVDTCTRILIKTANCSNCFELLAYSETYFSGETLTKKCVEIIGKNIIELRDSSEFVKMSLDLMKILCSCDRSLCNDEQLYLAIVKWLKFDMKNREQHISVLFDQIKFEEISIEFGIKKILNDNSLWKNQDYISKIMEIMSKNWTQQLDKKKHQKIFNCFEPKNLYAVIGNEMLLYDSKTKSFSDTVTEFHIIRQLFGYTTFEDENFFVCGGNINGTMSNDCTYFSLQENCWKSLPEMKIPRFRHRVITLNDKIYACGGEQEKTVEIFDISKLKWTSGPSFDRYIKNIGLCLYNDNIYGVDGSRFQFLDTRTDKWVALPSFPKCSNFMFSAINYKDYIYGFGIKGVCTFDIHANKWLKDVTMYEQILSSNYPRTCMINNEIYVLAKIHDAELLMFNSYKASNLSENISHVMESNSSCRALFSL